MNKELLRRPFSPGLVKQREGQNGKMLSYVETHAVIARLNEGCDAWSFEVVHHHVYKTEVVVIAKLLADGLIKMAFGGAAITIDRNGKAVSLADDLKAAASDALKKCASLLGVGLELYGARQQAAKPGPPTPRSPGVPRSEVRPSPETNAPNEGPSPKQLAAIYGVCRRKNISREHLAALVEKRTGRHRVEELTRRQASALLSELTEARRAHP